MHHKKLATAVLGTAVTLCFPLSAMAQQSAVTVYGVVDTFLTNIRAEGVPSAVRLDSSGLLASRLGFRGTESLGNGYSANFTLESGLNSNDGSAADNNRLFGRQAWVGVSGPYGEFRLGRQNTPQFAMNGRFDAFDGATQASGWNNMFGYAPRVDNAIGYISPVFSGLKLQALVARGATGGAPVAAETAANQSEHFGAEFENGPVYVGLHYQAIKALGAPDAKRTGLGTSFTVNTQWKLYADAEHETRSDDSQKSMLYSLSARYNFLPASILSFGWAGVRDSLSGKGHGNADQVSAQYRYLLSKRTTIYSAVSHLTQSDLRNSFSLNGAAVVEAGSQIKSTVPGGTINGVQLGLVHTF